MKTILSPKDAKHKVILDPKDAEHRVVLSPKGTKHKMIFFVRHGEALDDTEDRYGGWSDDPLSC